MENAFEHIHIIMIDFKLRNWQDISARKMPVSWVWTWIVNVKKAVSNVGDSTYICVLISKNVQSTMMYDVLC